MINAIQATQTNTATGTTASTQQTVDPLASENTFLKLLITQLKNQDPSSPQDPTQFVSQLAQFSDLEQTTQIRQDLDAIKQNLTTPIPTASTPASNGSKIKA